MFTRVFIHLKKTDSWLGTQWHYTRLIERLDKQAVRIHRLSIDSERTGTGPKLCCETDHFQEKSLKLRVRVLQPIRSLLRLAVAVS